MDIKKNIQAINEKISDIALSCGRDPDDIVLIAVTKTVSPSNISKALEAGLQNFGENRVQELVEKYDKIDKKAKWHLIGSLQTNKVKYIIDKVELIHSLDRIKLAKEIEKRAARIDRQIPALIQVNISGAMKQYPHIRIKGLMTIGPLTEDRELIRDCFRQMKKLFDEIKTKKFSHAQMQYLSMGMTNDFDIAIEEGANMVRIGRAIFGERKTP